VGGGAAGVAGVVGGGVDGGGVVVEGGGAVVLDGGDVGVGADIVTEQKTNKQGIALLVFVSLSSSFF
jgi:hypothetical protein